MTLAVRLDSAEVQAGERIVGTVEADEDADVTLAVVWTAVSTRGQPNDDYAAKVWELGRRRTFDVLAPSFPPAWEGRLLRIVHTVQVRSGGKTANVPLRIRPGQGALEIPASMRADARWVRGSLGARALLRWGIFVAVAPIVTLGLVVVPVALVVHVITSVRRGAWPDPRELFMGGLVTVGLPWTVPSLRRGVGREIVAPVRDWLATHGAVPPAVRLGEELVVRLRRPVRWALVCVEAVEGYVADDPTLATIDGVAYGWATHETEVAAGSASGEVRLQVPAEGPATVSEQHRRIRWEVRLTAGSTQRAEVVVLAWGVDR